MFTLTPRKNLRNEQDSSFRKHKITQKQESNLIHNSMLLFSIPTSSRKTQKIQQHQFTNFTYQLSKIQNLTSQIINPPPQNITQNLIENLSQQYSFPCKLFSNGFAFYISNNFITIWNIFDKDSLKTFPICDEKNIQSFNQNLISIRHFVPKNQTFQNVFLTTFQGNIKYWYQPNNSNDVYYLTSSLELENDEEIRLTFPCSGYNNFFQKYNLYDLHLLITSHGNLIIILFKYKSSNSSNDYLEITTKKIHQSSQFLSGIGKILSPWNEKKNQTQINQLNIDEITRVISVSDESIIILFHSTFQIWKFHFEKELELKQEANFDLKAKIITKLKKLENIDYTIRFIDISCENIDKILLFCEIFPPDETFQESTQILVHFFINNKKLKIEQIQSIENKDETKFSSAKLFSLKNQETNFIVYPRELIVYQPNNFDQNLNQYSVLSLKEPFIGAIKSEKKIILLTLKNTIFVEMKTGEQRIEENIKSSNEIIFPKEKMESRDVSPYLRYIRDSFQAFMNGQKLQSQEILMQCVFFIVDEVPLSGPNWVETNDFGATPILLKNQLKSKNEQFDIFIQYILYNSIYSALSAKVRLEILLMREKLSIASDTYNYIQRLSSEQQQQQYQIILKAMNRHLEIQSQNKENYLFEGLTTTERCFGNVSQIQGFVHCVIEEIKDLESQGVRFSYDQKMLGIFGHLAEILVLALTSAKQYQEDNIMLYKQDGQFLNIKMNMNINMNMNIKMSKRKNKKQLTNRIKESDLIDGIEIEEAQNIVTEFESLQDIEGDIQTLWETMKNILIDLTKLKEMPQTNDHLFKQFRIISDHYLSQFPKLFNSPKMDLIRKNIIQNMINFKQYTTAFHLCEKYFEFDTLILLCHQLNKVDKIDKFAEKFEKYNFADHLFKYYIDTKQETKLLTLPSKYNLKLKNYLARNQSKNLKFKLCHLDSQETNQKENSLFNLNREIRIAELHKKLEYLIDETRRKKQDSILNLTEKKPVMDAEELIDSFLNVDHQETQLKFIFALEVFDSTILQRNESENFRLIFKIWQEIVKSGDGRDKKTIKWWSHLGRKVKSGIDDVQFNNIAFQSVFFQIASKILNYENLKKKGDLDFELENSHLILNENILNELVKKFFGKRKKMERVFRRVFELAEEKEEKK
ncbi:nuclear pore complex protein nup133 [Anaeramoeba ignava]|uniref:Nuclear pore complex protein nup133 n=1 Tax=Anaeramoeba ignava TaxID=1746090 RepID=A0A9Q0R8X5_ANAIG|nr:nuclear pore complex protein nup133 [Anaeramoeba ignava]